MRRRSPSEQGLLRLLTHDPTTGGELIVTRLEGVESGVVIEGFFSLGWMGRLTPDQLEFAGLLLRHRGNVQRLASELGVSYNTARSRLDEIVAALGGAIEKQEEQERSRREVLDRLTSGEITPEEAVRLFRE